MGFLAVFLFGGSIVHRFLLVRENKARLNGERDYLVQGKSGSEIALLGDKRRALPSRLRIRMLTSVTGLTIFTCCSRMPQRTLQILQRSYSMFGRQTPCHTSNFKFILTVSQMGACDLEAAQCGGPTQSQTFCTIPESQNLHAALSPFPKYALVCPHHRCSPFPCDSSRPKSQIYRRSC
jgi:hypothetical protein